MAAAIKKNKISLNRKGCIMGMTEGFVKEAKGETITALQPLWDEVFLEDKGDFSEYYFNEKARDNHTFVITMEDSTEIADAVAMLHLTPYQMRMRVGQSFSNIPSFYIVGVATKEAYRHKGFMDRLLKASFLSMYADSIPFAFLMPADPQIYKPYDFTYIYERTEYEWKEKEENGLSWVMPLSETKMTQFLEYVNCRLEQNYDVFVRRDQEYYIRQIKELKAQGGKLYVINEVENTEVIDGYFLYAKDKEVFLQEVQLPKEGYPAIQANGKKPIIMARIIHVEAMLSLLRAKNKPVNFTILVKDKLIKGNNGYFACTIKKDKATIVKVEEETPYGKLYEKNDEIIQINVQELTAWIFGQKIDKEGIWVFNQKEIQTFNNVYINEIV